MGYVICYFVKFPTLQFTLFELHPQKKEAIQGMIAHSWTIVIDAYRTNCNIVKIEIDTGISVIGEATAERCERAVVQTVRAIAHYIVGKDSFHVKHYDRTFTCDSIWRTGEINRLALSGIEVALWDIRGKALGAPVFK